MNGTTGRERISTGVEGLDTVLSGGLVPGRSYMIGGPAGTGKTLFGLRFLLAGAQNGESTLFVGFEEPPEDIVDNAATLGMDLSDVRLLNLSAGSDFFKQDQSYDVFAPGEVETEGIVEEITAVVEECDPDRVVVDPLTRLRMLVEDDYLFRKTIQSFIRYLTERGATVCFTTQASNDDNEAMEYLSDGNIRLDHAEKGRVLSVTKFRGSDFQHGRHTMRITDEGLKVFPKLVPSDHNRVFEDETVSSGVEELDDLLHGGLRRGSVTVLSGPTGVGKSTVGSHFVAETANRGKRSVIYMFEEDTASFDHRSENIGLPITEMRESGRLHTEEVESLTVSADEFASMVREQVEQHDTELVMIDGTAGYRLSIRGDDDEMRRELHALCRFLRNMGVTVILVEETQTVTGTFQAARNDISYLADNIIFMRYVEVDGEIRKTLGVLKKRAGDFERTLRELQITDDGLRIREPLRGLEGILTGTPSMRTDARE